MIIDLMKQNPGQLSGEEVFEKLDDEYVMVNVNRLYLRQAHVVQYGTDKNEEKNIFDIIDGAIATVEDEKNMFVKMSVKDLKKCFSKELRALPVNSFKKVYG